MLESIFTETTQVSVSLGGCLICMVVAIVLGGVISFTHKFTTKTTPNFFNNISCITSTSAGSDFFG